MGKEELSLFVGLVVRGSVDGLPASHKSTRVKYNHWCHIHKLNAAKEWWPFFLFWIFLILGSLWDERFFLFQMPVIYDLVTGACNLKQRMNLIFTGFDILLLKGKRWITALNNLKDKVKYGCVETWMNYCYIHL